MPRRFDRETNFGQAGGAAGDNLSTEEWQKLALARIDWLAATGLPPLKTETLRVLVAQEKVRRSTELCLAARLDLLTASYQSNLLGGNRIGAHEAAIFLPESGKLKQAEEVSAAAGQEFSSQLYNLALLRLKHDPIGALLEGAACQAAADMIYKQPKTKVISLWALTYNTLTRERAYGLNQPTQALHTRINELQGKEPENLDLPLAPLSAALFHYYTCLLDDRLPTEETEVLLDNIRLASGCFFQANTEEAFPDGFGDLLGD